MSTLDKIRSLKLTVRMLDTKSVTVEKQPSTRRLIPQTEALFDRLAAVPTIEKTLVSMRR
jgi:hypothetical protein